MLNRLRAVNALPASSKPPVSVYVVNVAIVTRTGAQAHVNVANELRYADFFRVFSSSVRI